MSIPISELREQLSDIEPSERTYEGIGAAEVDALRELANDPSPWVAAQAVHALSRIDAESARSALFVASWSSRAEIRVAVAASARNLPPDVSDQVLSRLLSDSDIGVRKFAIKSLSDRNSYAVRQRLKEIATAEAQTGLRKLADEKARSLSGP